MICKASSSHIVFAMGSPICCIVSILGSLLHFSLSDDHVCERTSASLCCIRFVSFFRASLLVCLYDGRTQFYLFGLCFGSIFLFCFVSLLCIRFYCPLANNFISFFS